MDKIITTAPHPFYVHGKGFVPAANLEAGDDLFLAGDDLADVVSVTIRHANPAETFTTYNFEVAEFHTYFVDNVGVWAHNSGKGFCERMFSLYKQIADTRNLNDKPWDAFKILLEKTAGMSKKIDVALPDTVEDVMRQAYAKANSNGLIDLNKVPTHADVTEAMAGRMGAALLESNHTAPRYIQALLGITDGGI